MRQQNVGWFRHTRTKSLQKYVAYGIDSHVPIWETEEVKEIKAENKCHGAESKNSYIKQHGGMDSKQAEMSPDNG